MTMLLFDDCTRDASETEELGYRLSEVILPELCKTGFVFIALNGELGAGKTAFIRGLMRRFNEDTYVHSPSYTILNEYRGRCPDGAEVTVAHFDVWRIHDEDDLFSVGFFDWFPSEIPDNPNAYAGGNSRIVMAVEWGENIEYALPDSLYIVDIEGSGNEPRHIRVFYKDKT